MDGSTIADLVGEHLQDHSIRRSEFAAEVGVSTQTVSNWLRGRDFPSDVHVPKLARALRISEQEVILATARGRREKTEVASMRDEVKTLRREVKELRDLMGWIRARLEEDQAAADGSEGTIANGP
jgi:transcriptional regulator with XRE-family HTH domain